MARLVCACPCRQGGDPSSGAGRPTVVDLLHEGGVGGTRLGTVVVATVLVYVAVVVLTRLAGPRSLAKMSSFDFAATVAVGSTLSSTATGSVPLAAGAAALAVLFGLQALVGALRRRGALGGAVDNRPLLLLAHGQVLDDALAQARISRSELWSQLRASGVRRLGDVHAVVLETTGDLSVLPAGQGGTEPVLMEGVRGAERLRT